MRYDVPPALVNAPIRRERTRNRRQRVLAIFAAVVIVGGGTALVVALTWGHTFVVSGNVGFTDRAEWAGSDNGTCRPTGTAAALDGATFEAVAPDGDVVFRHVLDDFVVGGGNCVSYFHNIDFPDVADEYLVRVAGRQVGVLTRDRLVGATSPDAYPGVAFVLTGCADVCELAVSNGEIS